MGIQGGRANSKLTQELFKMKANRLVSGFLTINVRHDDPDTTGDNEFDVNQAFSATDDSSTNLPIVIGGRSGWELAGTAPSTTGGGMWSTESTQYPYLGSRPNFTNADGSGLTTAMATTDNTSAVEREIATFTKADPAVITVTGGHFFINGDYVRVKNVGGTTADDESWESLNGNVFQVEGVSNETLTLGTATADIMDSGPGANDVDTTGFAGTYDTTDKGSLVGVKNRRYYVSVSSWGSDSDDTIGAASSPTIKAKHLSLGDYDSFCYYVTAGLTAVPPYWVAGTRRYRFDTNEYYWSKPPSHDNCQSWVKSHLISRINNSSRTNYEDMLLGQHTNSVPLDETAGDLNSDMKRGMVKGGMRRVKYTIPESHGLGRYQDVDKDIHVLPFQSNGTTAQDYMSTLSDLTKLGMNCDLSEEEYLFNNGVYSHTGNFGIDLSDRIAGASFRRGGEDNNSFFTPVYDVDIYAHHPMTYTSHTKNRSDGDLPVNSDVHASDDPGIWFAQNSVGNQIQAVHSEAYWHLAVDVYHWAFTKNDGSSYPENLYSPVNVEIIWQPFGETSELEVD